MSSAPVPANRRRIMRRSLTAGVAALLAAGVTKLTAPQPVQANDGQALTLGQVNTSEGSTTVNRSNASISASGLKVTNNRGIGLEGTSQTAAGVYGVSTNGYGVIAQTDGGNEGLLALSAGGISLRADTTTGIAVAGTSTTGFGGYFSTTAGGYAIRTEGRVLINGDFSATGMKSAVVPGSDGVHRRLYCMESPEPFFEDIGTDRLTNGVKRVQLDPEFRQLVRSDNYLVFITPLGNCQGLYVSQQSAAGFEVRELNNGSSDVSFTYRVAAKRKDISGERLQRVPIEQRKKFRDAAEIIREIGGSPPRR
jgi:hypothetical protein